MRFLFEFCSRIATTQSSSFTNSHRLSVTLQNLEFIRLHLFHENQAKGLIDPQHGTNVAFGTLITTIFLLADPHQSRARVIFLPQSSFENADKLDVCRMLTARSCIIDLSAISLQPYASATKQHKV